MTALLARKPFPAALSAEDTALQACTGLRELQAPAGPPQLRRGQPPQRCWPECVGGASKATQQRWRPRRGRFASGASAWPTASPQNPWPCRESNICGARGKARSWRRPCAWAPPWRRPCARARVPQTLLEKGVAIFSDHPGTGNGEGGASDAGAETGLKAVKVVESCGTAHASHRWLLSQTDRERLLSNIMDASIPSFCGKCRTCCVSKRPKSSGVAWPCSSLAQNVWHCLRWGLARSPRVRGRVWHLCCGYRARRGCAKGSHYGGPLAWAPKAATAPLHCESQCPAEDCGSAPTTGRKHRFPEMNLRRRWLPERASCVMERPPMGLRFSVVIDDVAGDGAAAGAAARLTCGNDIRPARAASPTVSTHVHERLWLYGHMCTHVYACNRSECLLGTRTATHAQA